VQSRRRDDEGRSTRSSRDRKRVARSRGTANGRGDVSACVMCALCVVERGGGREPSFFKENKELVCPVPCLPLSAAPNQHHFSARSTPTKHSRLALDDNHSIAPHQHLWSSRCAPSARAAASTRPRSIELTPPSSFSLPFLSLSCPRTAVRRRSARRRHVVLEGRKLCAAVSPRGERAHKQSGGAWKSCCSLPPAPALTPCSPPHKTHPTANPVQGFVHARGAAGRG